MSSNNTAIPNAFTIFVKKLAMKKGILIVAILSIILNLFLGYTFMIKGETAKASDGRTAIIMTQGNKDFVFSEMRGFLESVQQINEGILHNNPQQIITAAQKSGGSVAEHAPKGLMKSLPAGFKALGMSTHSLFDEIAKSTTENVDTKSSQKQLNTILNNCISCHQNFKIGIKPAQ